MIIDPGGGFYSRHWGGQSSADVLLNPFDERTVGWSPFVEIEADYDYKRLAAALVPAATGETEEWLEKGRVLMANVMRSMRARGQRSTKQLYRWLTEATPERLGNS